jgi:hypothetical protein
MPDTSLADYAGIAGAFFAALIAGLGLRKGEKDKTSLPAPNDAHSGGVFVGLDSKVEQEILAELKGLRADQAAWRKEDREERRANEVEELKDEIADLKRGQGKTHENQKGLAEQIAELLRQPGVSDERERIRKLPRHGD